MSSQQITRELAKSIVLAALLPVLAVSALWSTACGPKIPPAILDPLVAACASDLAQWSYVQTLAPELNLTPDQLARALCSVPAVLLPYKQKAADAGARARAAVQLLSESDAGVPIADAGTK